MKSRGWIGEKERHALASKGVSTIKARYGVGKEYCNETPQERNKRRLDIKREARECGKHDPDSIFFDEELHKRELEEELIASGHIKQFVLRSESEKDDETGEPLYWNNDLGWVDFKSATKFKKSQVDDLEAKTMDAKWEKI